MSGDETNKILGAPVLQEEKFEGLCFDPKLEGLKDASAHRRFNVKTSIERATKGKLPGFTLCPPAVCEKHMATAVDNVDTNKFYIAVVGIDSMANSLRANPMKSYLVLNEYVSHICWPSPSQIICASGSGNIVLLKVNEDDQSVKVTGDANGVHTDTIREISAMPGSPHIFASGGFDKRLCLVDLHRRHVLQKLDTAQVVGSVKWSTFHEACVAATTDSGKFYLFDIRSTWAKPALSFNSNIPDLYTSERFSDFDCLLGFSTGRITHMDLRSRKSLSTICDPFVEAIGNISYNLRNNAFTVSGLSDFTIWKREPDRCYVYTHSLHGKAHLAGRDVFTTGAAWCGDDVLVSADSCGMAAVHLLDWDA